MKYLLYGANGYTAGLIIRFTEQYGITPVLAGRTEAKIQPLAEQNGLEYKVFDLSDPMTVEEHLKEFQVVLHCAGPFKFTARPMMEACMATGTHYLDITGEIEVFELAHRLGDRAKQAGVMLMPGVGFDVVPTDCMAKYLSEKMPDATHLSLAFASVGGKLSHGTATTMAENLGESGAIRQGGKIIPMPIGHKAKMIHFGDKERFAMTIPWGDVSTAYHTTGIPNIEVFTAVPKKTHNFVKRWLPLLNPLLRTSFVRNYRKRQINKKPAGPTDEMRTKAQSRVWGEVSNENNHRVGAWLSCPEGYTITAHAALHITREVLKSNVRPGHWTPAGMYGADLIMQFEGVERVDL